MKYVAVVDYEEEMIGGVWREIPMENLLGESSLDCSDGTGCMWRATRRSGWAGFKGGVKVQNVMRSSYLYCSQLLALVERPTGLAESNLSALQDLQTANLSVNTERSKLIKTPCS